MNRLVVTGILVAALATGVWAVQWKYLDGGRVRVNRLTRVHQVRVCERRGPREMTLEEKKEFLRSYGVKIDPAATSIDPVYEELIRGRLKNLDIRTVCFYR